MLYDLLCLPGISNCGILCLEEGPTAGGRSPEGGLYQGITVAILALRRGPPQVGGVLKADQSVPKYKGWYLKWN